MKINWKVFNCGTPTGRSLKKKKKTEKGAKTKTSSSLAKQDHAELHIYEKSHAITQA